jgi:exodeoxyribonuclease-3
LQLVTWNVNSIRTRLDRVVAWVSRHHPDVVCLQETKVVDEAFPREALESLGYHLETFGQKTYNGVALLSRSPLAAVRRGLPDDAPDAQRRLIAATIDGVTVVNVYVPNGSSPESEKFAYKLDWLDRLARFLEDEADPESPLALCGDFNIAPEDRDVHDPDEWRGQVLFHPDEHAALARLTRWGLADALRLVTPDGGLYSWWDYRAAAFRRDRGLRIDLVLVTRPLASRVAEVAIDREERAGERPSDHAPVTAVFR